MSIRLSTQSISSILASPHELEETTSATGQTTASLRVLACATPAAQSQSHLLPQKRRAGIVGKPDRSPPKYFLTYGCRGRSDAAGLQRFRFALLSIR